LNDVTDGGWNRPETRVIAGFSACVAFFALV
jgi:hypothetical protein